MEIQFSQEKESACFGHTPGPWAYKYPFKDPCVIGADGKLVAFQLRVTRGLDEGTANAALIAAAPEMLSALESCLTHLNSSISTEEKVELVRGFIEGAIAVAEGRED